jgi:hypothetical protein
VSLKGNVARLHRFPHVQFFFVLAGHDAVADPVNSSDVTRSAWRNVALDPGVRFLEIERICSGNSLVAARRHRATVICDLIMASAAMFRISSMRRYNPAVYDRNSRPTWSTPL